MCKIKVLDFVADVNKILVLKSSCGFRVTAVAVKDIGVVWRIFKVRESRRGCCRENKGLGYITYYWASTIRLNFWLSWFLDMISEPT